MEQYNIYKDMEARTGGELYLGVVGPVRTGKSTFIKRFMERMVLPEIEDEHHRARTRDELPQSAAGVTIMTTEPKFIPKEAARLQLGDGVSVQVRLIDCVGFMVDGAGGHMEQERERLVKTPWFEEEIPFTRAAEIGTRKVIRDHSTIGLVVTADGSFGDLKRDSYIQAEKTAVSELKAIGKPFLVLLNSAHPYSEDTRTLQKSLEKEYGVSVMAVNCEQLKTEDINRILEQVLQEFPVTEVDFYIPRWVEILPSTHWLKEQIIRKAGELMGKIRHMKDVPQDFNDGSEPAIRSMKTEEMDMSNGRIRVQVGLEDGYYYQILSDYAGIEIEDEYQLMEKLKELSAMQGEYG